LAAGINVMSEAAVGFLTDIRSGKRAVTGPGAVIFWFAAGMVLSGGIAALAGASESFPLYLLTVPGALLGAMVGFYAAWGTSRLARVLAIPGIIVDVLSGLVGW
jgi:hypothetical protein